MGSPLLFRPRHILWLQKLYRVFRLQEFDSIPLQKLVRISCIQKRFRSIAQFYSFPQFGFRAEVRKPLFRNSFPRFGTCKPLLRNGFAQLWNCKPFLWNSFAQFGNCKPLFRNSFTQLWNRKPLFRNSFTRFRNCEPLFRDSFTQFRNCQPLIRNSFTQFRQQPCSFSIYIPQAFIKFKL